MRLKLSQELKPDGNPGPGQYDVAESTIGNWGAGMATSLPTQEDTFLAERTAMFAQTCQMPIESEELRECIRRQRVVVVPRSRKSPRARERHHTQVLSDSSEMGLSAVPNSRLRAMQQLYVNDV
jgi:hypothetical protein